MGSDIKLSTAVERGLCCACISDWGGEKEKDTFNDQRNVIQ
jgi:hypothetical protein